MYYIHAQNPKLTEMLVTSYATFFCVHNPLNYHVHKSVMDLNGFVKMKLMKCWSWSYSTCATDTGCHKPNVFLLSIQFQFSSSFIQICSLYSRLANGHSLHKYCSGSCCVSTGTVYTFLKDFLQLLYITYIVTIQTLALPPK